MFTEHLKKTNKNSIQSIKTTCILNEEFHKIFKAQFNQNISADIRNIVHHYSYPTLHRKEKIVDYINRVIDKNIKKIDSSNKALAPYFHEMKIIVNKAIQIIPANKISNSSLKTNGNDNFMTLIESIQSSCLNPQKTIISTHKIKLFFHFIAQYLSKESINKTIFYNEITGASYKKNGLDIKDYDSANEYEFNTFKMLDENIDNAINKKQTLACDLCNQIHAVAIIIKSISGSDSVNFEFFDPNKGLFITKNKKHLLIYSIR